MHYAHIDLNFYKRIPIIYAYKLLIIFSFAIWNTIMGTSLLAMPWSVERAGLVMGLLLMFSIAALCLYTANRILKVQVLHGK